MTRLILVRHAQAVCNVDETWAGHDTCVGLTQFGRDQCHSIADRLVEMCADHHDVVLFSSVLPRARETAQPIAQRLGLTLHSRCDLCERHPGSLDGMAIAQARDLDLAHAERRESFQVRVRRALRKIAAPGIDRTVVAVTHGGVIAASFWTLGGVSARLPFRLDPANGSITVWSDTSEGRQWRLDSYNDVPGGSPR
ncbi:histidine phosphatase family protein [Sphaerisporangium fuscum]|uniref:histidine phosphatase family protein n=1 Tax=Sphaerisporangium fuscum TaxID=2835868 RepID=UPI001BDBBB34|nr:histidine phosphatase family protein [Sphaerisporangium fuscum]